MRFNISDISDKKSSAPLMLPPAEQFEEQVGKVQSVHVGLYEGEGYIVIMCNYTHACCQHYQECNRSVLAIYI